MKPMRVAVVTPAFAEAEDVLEQCKLSVRRQSWPHLHHFVIVDGGSIDIAGDEYTTVVKLPTGCRDYGDTPRALGALYAFGIGFDAVTFLDGDNWFYPQHVECLVALAGKTGAVTLSTRRAFHRLDGTYMACCTTSNGEEFSDTNGVMVLRQAAHLLATWAVMPKQLHPVGDRVFWQQVRSSAVLRAHHPQPTVAYRVQHKGIYHDLKEPAPPHAKDAPAISAAVQAAKDAGLQLPALRWGYSAPLKRSDVLDVKILTIREVGAVNLTRVGRPYRSLAEHGWVRVEQGTGLRIDPSSQPGVVVLHRHFMSDLGLLKSLDQLASAGWLLMSDIDDDPHHWNGYVASRMVAFKAVHVVTVSTPSLAEMIRPWNPNVVVLPNMLDDLPPPLLKKRDRFLAGEASQDRTNSLRVFFGALNRTEDAQALLEGLRLLPVETLCRLEFHVIHDRRFFDSLPEHVGKRFYPLCDWAAYMTLMGECDVGVLPLRDTHFNRFKSDLKLIESLAAGVVPICSSVVYQSLHGADASYVLYADEPGQWADQLLGLINNPRTLDAMRSAGYRYVREHRMQWQQNAERMSQIRGWAQTQKALEVQRQDRLAAWANEASVER